MIIPILMRLSGSLMLLQPTAVDFKLDGVSSPQVVSVQPPNQSITPNDQPVVALPPRLARGFGNDVPLAFAVRQVVPHYWHVEYDDAVNQNLRVSWTGGKPWREVLRAVLQPIGMHTVTTGSTIRITE